MASDERAPESAADPGMGVEAVSTDEPLPTAESLPGEEPVNPEATATETRPAAGVEPGSPSTVEDAPEPTAPTAVPEAPAEEVEPVAAPPRPVTVGAYLAAALRAAGVKVAFTVPGESFLGLLDALEGAGIRAIATRHESGAAFMAEAYGQLTGRPAACLATRAVGAANLAIGIHTARQDSTPMFAVVGDVRRDRRGRESFQEADLVTSLGGLAKHAVALERPTAVARALDDAVRSALSGRPGPAFISVPEDLLDETFLPAGLPVARRMGPPPPDPDDLKAVLRLLTDARRPVIVAGAGVLRARATADLVRLAEILEVPVIAAWRRPDVFPNDHPLYLGQAGYGAPGTVRERLEAADGLLVIGSRLNEPTTFDYRIPAAGARWAHVDLEPRRAHAGLRAPDLAITADARSFLRAAKERLAGAVHLASPLDERRTANAADRAAWEAATQVDRGDWRGPGVHPGRVVATLRELLPKDAIVVTDAGNFGGWAARGFRYLRPGTFLGPTSGAMGYAVPAAVAAALVHRDRPVVALAGDGGFAMTMAEIETAVRERLRPTILVFDNGRYGTIRAHQEVRGTGIGVATELGPIDAAGVATAMGALGIRVERDDEVEDALRQALAADRPTVIHLPVDPAWVSVDRTPLD